MQNWSLYLCVYKFLFELDNVDKKYDMYTKRKALTSSLSCLLMLGGIEEIDSILEKLANFWRPIFRGTLCLTKRNCQKASFYDYSFYYYHVKYMP